MSDTIKRWIRNWLGIPQVEASAASAMRHSKALARDIAHMTKAAIDVGYTDRGNTQIIIISRLNGGYVGIIDMQASNLRDVARHAASLTATIRPEFVIDAPHSVRQALQHDLGISISRKRSR